MTLHDFVKHSDTVVNYARWILQKRIFCENCRRIIPSPTPNIDFCNHRRQDHQ